ncbi:lysine exporter LysO family protein [Acerihabitans sp. TG2]|uniref:lysine exporter LysO family protein n=1 Tax=Acerihabitans sp. TG2 TaxID=3096008 RepID=UPI002B231B20|nr:lysine exporter LysO family protein [Acerihabitans sp. TG2]MEA9390623.1 lysine exporter LysO family protein [Acerihabitans sp. TG2]
MYSGLLIILIPLIAGYLLPRLGQNLRRILDRLLSAMVYIILFFMGISLAFLDNLATNLLLIVWYAGVSALCILAANALALWWLEKRAPWRGTERQAKPPSRLRMAMDSLQLCLVVISGFVVGLTQWHWLSVASKASEFALILLLLLVGIQLRNSGMTLRQILLNRRGASIALVVAASAMLGGAVAAIVLHLPLHTGLAMASAFGWYSLSGILMSDAFGPVIGSAAFFNDLVRELLAIMLIPGLMRRSRSVALGLCGATSMDFTLPVLQRSGGLEVVPAAIVHGFLLSLLAPVLIALFSA